MSQNQRKPRRVRKSSRDYISRATIGSHVTDVSRSSSRKSSTTHNFSNPRKSARAQRGMVDQVMPETRSGESAADHSKRVHKSHYTVAIRRKSYIKGIAFALVALVLIVGIAAAVGMFVFGNSISDRVALKDSETKAALVSPDNPEVSYTLIVGEYYKSGTQYNGPEVLILARLDQELGQVTLMSIPYTSQVYLSDGRVGRICEAQLEGGDAALIKTVSSFAGVDISHIVKSDNERFVQLVDALGGIEVNVEEEVDDPNAGSVYIEEGVQTLNGEEALTLSRATNLSTGGQMQSENQCKILLALAKDVLEADGFSLFTEIDSIADKFETDCDFSSIQSLVEAFKGIEDSHIYVARVPGYSTISANTNIRYFVPDEAAFASMMEQMDAGQAPVDVSSQTQSVDPASFDITVRNGSGVAGGATQVAEVLTTQGYQIKETGNADQYVYEETLVIYAADDMRNAAESVVSSLGIGRAVPSNSFYTFESGVLVVVGKDWKPFN
ncbi:MAG: LCP family protein [Raoultibacter sp.]|jgi:LCP family protein required for cell wall assembly